MLKTFTTEFPSQVQRLKLAFETSGLIWWHHQLMRVESLEMIDGKAVAELMPAELPDMLAA